MIMTLTRIVVVLLICQFYLLSSAIGQSSILDNYVQSALKDNLSLKNDDLNLEKQLSLIQQANKLWKPQLNLDASYLLARGGRVLIFPIGDLFNPTYEAINTLSGANSFPTNLENEEIQLTPNNFLDAQVSLSKPLINSSIKYNQKIQEEILKLKSLDKELTKREIRYQVKTAYYNILKSHQAEEILGENQSLLNELLKFNETLVKYDKATTEIISDVEYQLSTLDQQLATIQEQKNIAQSYFNLLLNRPLTKEVTIDSTLTESISLQATSLSDYIQRAKENRSEYNQLNTASSINLLNKERIDSEKKPTLGVTAGIGYQSEDFDFDLGGPLYTLGLGMSWNIMDGGLRKEKIQELTVDQDIINNNKNQLSQQIELEVTQAYYGLNSVQSQLIAQEAAIKNATASYNIIKTRYENDRALLIELLQSQTQLINAKLTKVITQYDYLGQMALIEKQISK